MYKLPDGTVTTDPTVYGTAWVKLGDDFLALLPEAVREGWCMKGLDNPIIHFSRYVKTSLGDDVCAARMTIPAPVALALIERLTIR